MDEAKRKRLENAGWRTGTAQEFLGMTDEEWAVVKSARYEIKQHLRYALDECNRALLQARRVGLPTEQIEECCSKVRDALHL